MEVEWLMANDLISHVLVVKLNKTRFRKLPSQPTHGHLERVVCWRKHGSSAHFPHTYPMHLFHMAVLELYP